jgi:hypothetical protein
VVCATTSAQSTHGLTPYQTGRKLPASTQPIGWRSSMAIMQIKGVKAYVSNGKTYAYHRKSGKPLQSTYGSAEFLAELAEIERAYKTGKQTDTDAKPGTWGALVIKYKSDRLPQLARRTQSDYHKVLDWLSPLGAMPLFEWSRGFAIQTRDSSSVVDASPTM